MLQVTTGVWLQKTGKGITKQKEQENGQSTMMNHQVWHNVDQARKNVSI